MLWKLLFSAQGIIETVTKSKKKKSYLKQPSINLVLTRTLGIV